MSVQKKTLVKLCILYCILFTTMRSLLGQYFGILPNLAFIGVHMVLIFFYFFRYQWMKTKIRKNAFFLFYFIFFATYILNFLVAPHSSRYSFYEYGLYLLMFFSFSFVYENVDFEWIVKAYVFICSVVALEAIWEYVTGNILYRISYTGAQVIRRSFGLVGSPLTLGMLLACTSLMAIYCAVYYSKIFWPFAFLHIAGMLCTQSRGPIIAFAFGLMTMYLVGGDILDKNRVKEKIRRVIAIIAIIIAIFLLILLLKNYFPFFNALYERLSTVSEFGQQNATNNERVNRWANALSIFKQHPLIGYGVSSTGPHANTGIITESGALKLLAETGFCGSFFYFGFILIGIFTYGRTCINAKIKEAPLAICITLAILTENVVLQILESATIFQIFMLMLSFLVFSKYKTEASS